MALKSLGMPEPILIAVVPVQAAIVADQTVDTGGATPTCSRR